VIWGGSGAVKKASLTPVGAIGHNGGFPVSWREEAMKKMWKKFLWSSNFWAVIGALACVAGFYFQGAAGNGLGLWFLGLVFFGAAYIEKSL
jgi:hypothetical protein